MNIRNLIVITVAFLVIFIVTIIIILLPPKENFSNMECKYLNVKILDSGLPGMCIGLIGGVHGNEPAGSVALTNFLKTKIKPIKGKIIVIPEANHCGLQMSTRVQPFPDSKNKEDINRNYTKKGGTDIKTKKILKALKECDLVIDFHEAWGYWKTTPYSVGSTLIPTTTQLSTSLAEKAVSRLNKNITDNDKKFETLTQKSCTINTTMGCHMEKNKRNYILVEVTGQEDIQQLETRVSQNNTVIYSILSDLEMI
jgi:predicted deacylase